MMLRFRSARLAATAAGLLFLATMTASNSQPALETVHVTASLVDGVTPILYAQSAGLFRKAGLDVVLERATTGATTAAAVAGGSVDIGQGNVIPIIAAHARGVPLIFIAPAAIYDPRTPDAALIVSADSPIHSATDLIGKTIGTTSLADLPVVANDAWMDSVHADWHGVQYVEVTLPTMTAALEEGRVQAALHIKPLLTDAVDTGKARVLALVLSAISDHFLESGWFTNTSYLVTHKDTVAKFARVLAEASAYANGHHAETVPLFANWTGVDPQRAARVARVVWGTTLRARDLQPVIDNAARYNVIGRSFDANEIIAQF